MNWWYTLVEKVSIFVDEAFSEIDGSILLVPPLVMFLSFFSVMPLGALLGVGAIGNDFLLLIIFSFPLLIPLFIFLSNYPVSFMINFVTRGKTSIMFPVSNLMIQPECRSDTYHFSMNKKTSLYPNTALMFLLMASSSVIGVLGLLFKHFLGVMLVVLLLAIVGTVLLLLARKAYDVKELIKDNEDTRN